MLPTESKKNRTRNGKNTSSSAKANTKLKTTATEINHVRTTTVYLLVPYSEFFQLLRHRDKFSTKVGIDQSTVSC